jgi:hypothetical protein
MQYKQLQSTLQTGLTIGLIFAALILSCSAESGVPEVQVKSASYGRVLTAGKNVAVLHYNVNAFFPGREFKVSPNGKFVAFSVFRDPAAGKESYEWTSDVFIHNLQTGETTQLSDSKIRYFDPIFTPDGMRVVFIGETGRPGDPGSIFLVDLDGENRREIRVSMPAELEMPDIDSARHRMPILEFRGHTLLIPVSGVGFDGPIDAVAEMWIPPTGE